MNYLLDFGKRKAKLQKKMLDSLSLVKLKKLAKKYKVSCYKKGTKVCVKKSTLLKRLKKNRSINKILKSAKSMKRKSSPKRARKSSPKRRRSPKRARKSRFGDISTLRNVPNLSTPLELSLGQTYDYQTRRYKSIPTSFISQNLMGTGAADPKTRMQLASKNFPFTQGSLGRSSLPPYKNINSKFGRYFQ